MIGNHMTNKEVKTKEELLIKINKLESKIAELEKSEFKISSWLANSPVCTKVLDLDFNLQYMSNAGVRALQIDDVSAFYGKPYPLSFFPDSFNIPMRDNLNRAKETGETIIQEGEIQDVKGNKLWFQATITPVHNKQGGIDHILVVSIDTSIRKRAEEALRLKNLVFDASIAANSIADIDGVITEVNDAFIQMWGSSNKDEVLGKRIVKFFQDQGEAAGIITSLGLTDKWEGNYIAKKKDGSTFLAYGFATSIKDENGTIVGYQSSVQDITERKEAEDSVRKLSTAVQQSPSLIAITDTEGKLEYVNPKFTELTGYSSTDVIGQKPSILKSGEQKDSFYKDLWQTVVSDKIWRGQFHNKKKNGELFWEAASISAILNESGEIINYIKIGEDITQQKINEEELNKALEKALESDRLKSAFLTNMSHEIRTPMNGILGFIDLLNEPSLSRIQIDQYSAIINKSSNRLLNTINDIIDISKIEAGEVVVSTTETSLNSELDELYSFHCAEAKMKGLSLFFEPSLSHEQATIFTDSHKLHGILTNLIKNAIKYTEKGSIEFGVSARSTTKLKADSEPDEVEFFVKDTGIGIPENRMKAIFNRFEQADIGDERAFEGSGLGLAISKAYVEMLGGEIFVESEEGIGSTFTFTIPYVKTEKNELGQKPENFVNGPASLENLNLLIVEDDDVSSELIEAMIKDTFRKITFAENGIEAIEICRNNPEINLVLMDVKMPKMNGYDATREIRKFNKNVLIIAQTAYALLGDKQEAIEAGCNDYISKPFNKKELLEIISKHLGAV